MPITLQSHEINVLNSRVNLINSYQKSNNFKSAHQLSQMPLSALERGVLSHLREQLRLISVESTLSDTERQLAEVMDTDPTYQNMEIFSKIVDTLNLLDIRVLKSLATSSECSTDRALTPVPEKRVSLLRNLVSSGSEKLKRKTKQPVRTIEDQRKLFFQLNRQLLNRPEYRSVTLLKNILGTGNQLGESKSENSKDQFRLSAHFGNTSDKSILDHNIRDNFKTRINRLKE